jgi:hypothetical protein
MIGEISFAGKTAFNIKCIETKKTILDEIENHYKCKIIARHHDVFNESIHLHKLRSNPHLVCVKTNGNPYLLYLTKINFVNVCIFIDKKVQQGYTLPRMIVSRFSFDDDLFSGTLFDGEMMVDNNRNWVFLISDLVAHAGRYLENQNIVKRLNIVFALLESQFQEDNSDVCLVQVKKYFTYANASEMLDKFIPSLNYTCRGVYFKPLFLKFNQVLLNFDNSLVVKVFRKKFSETKCFLTGDDISNEHAGQPTSPPCSSPETCPPSPNKPAVEKPPRVFTVRKTNMPDIYMLTCEISGEESVACIPSLETSKLMRAVFHEKGVSDRVLMNCTFSNVFKKWTPVQTITSGSPAG